MRNPWGSLRLPHVNGTAAHIEWNHSSSSVAIPKARGTYQRLLHEVTRSANSFDKSHSLRQASSNRRGQHATSSMIVARFDARSGKPQGGRIISL
jgi:hypothetical protein